MEPKRYAWLQKVYERIAPPLAALFIRRLAFEGAPLPEGIQAPYLVLSNHNTDYDPILLSASFPKHMFFVSSAHVLRRGLGAYLLRACFAPIARQKGGTDASAAMGILKTLREGHSVCLFAEGNRSFDGRTGPVQPATAKLVKAARCTLITYKLEGGYLSSPRWSFTLRKGRMRGQVVNVYTPEQLAAMDIETLRAHIQEDIAEDAYARQARERVPYKGWRLAAGLETTLFLCPRCGGIGTMHSHGNHMLCDCGLDVTYDSLGYLHGAPFETVTAWYDFQYSKLKKLVKRPGEFFADKRAALWELDPFRRAAKGRLCMDAAALRVGDALLPLADISNMAAVGRNTLVLTFEGKAMQLNGGRRFNALKYLLAYQRREV